METRRLARVTVLMCAVMLSACNQPNGVDLGEEIPVAPIVAESNSAFEEADRRVIRDTIEWAVVWARIYETRSPKPPLPAIDFSREQVVIAALGKRPSSGYVVRITGASGTSNAIKVRFESQSPGTGCAVLPVMTHPVDVVKMPRTVGSVVFEETPRVRSCG